RFRPESSRCHASTSAVTDASRSPAAVAKDKRRHPVCPADGAALIMDKIKVVDNSDYLLQKTVLCVNSPFGCSHQCKLEDLQRHYEECQFCTCSL
ncbi:hypothetical protein MTO96_045956, partial [Rhipicephalus appendiculatus]